MSDIDLTEAVDAALTATIPPHKPAVTWRRDIADPAVRAALPHIERQVREQVAREIEATPRSSWAYQAPFVSTWSDGFRYAVWTAASIAREGT